MSQWPRFHNRRYHRARSLAKGITEHQSQPSLCEIMATTTTTTSTTTTTNHARSRSRARRICPDCAQPMPWPMTRRADCPYPLAAIVVQDPYPTHHPNMITGTHSQDKAKTSPRIRHMRLGSIITLRTHHVGTMAETWRNTYPYNRTLRTNRCRCI